MQIKNIQKTTTKQHAFLTAIIEINGEKPKNVYIAVPRKFSSYIFADGSPFLAAFLIPAMKKDEPLYIDGTVSQRLYDHTQEIMSLLHSWNKKFHMISIRTKKLTKDTIKSEKNASFFSGGIDSFYTYLKHRRDKYNRISQFLFVHGFDIELQNKSFFNVVKKRIERTSQTEKVPLLVISTNIREVTESLVEWEWNHGGALASVALALRNKLSKVYIAASLPKKDLFPYGTHPLLDKLWSTENLTIVHDGIEHTRLQKVTNYISKSHVAIANLHVCTQNIKGKYNCSSCFKCLRTMIELVIADVQDQAKTFDFPINLNKVKNMYLDYSVNYNREAEENLRTLKRQKREPALQKAISISLQKSKKPSMRTRLVTSIAHFDKTYNKRRLYQLIVKRTRTNDRNFMFKVLAQKGFIK